MKFVYIFLLCILYTLPWSSYGSPAKYSGTHAADAKHVLDRSQGKKGFGFSNRGHPRNHASAASGPSVEKYSRHSGQPKSGFDSRHGQNEAAHAALSHPKTQAAMGILNQYHPNTHNTIGHKRQVVKLSQHELQMQHLSGGKWKNGSKKSSFPVGGAVVVMQHHAGEEQNPNAPVHVQTFYPN